MPVRTPSGDGKEMIVHVKFIDRVPEKVRLTSEFLSRLIRKPTQKTSFQKKWRVFRRSGQAAGPAGHLSPGAAPSSVHRLSRLGLEASTFAE